MISQILPAVVFLLTNLILDLLLLTTVVVVVVLVVVVALFVVFVALLRGAVATLFVLSFFLVLCAFEINCDKKK